MVKLWNPFSGRGLEDGDAGGTFLMKTWEPGLAFDRGGIPKWRVMEYDDE